MSVKPDQIENREQDLNVTNRDPKGAKEVRETIQSMKPKASTAEDELLALRKRIDVARMMVPVDDRPHCADCFNRGWKAALKSLEG